ncbi:MAG: hypothetical protein U0168_21780 [Nannocystaceae bacterium]
MLVLDLHPHLAAHAALAVVVIDDLDLRALDRRIAEALGAELGCGPPRGANERILACRTGSTGRLRRSSRCRGACTRENPQPPGLPPARASSAAAAALAAAASPRRLGRAR